MIKLLLWLFLLLLLLMMLLVYFYYNINLFIIVIKKNFVYICFIYIYLAQLLTVTRPQYIVHIVFLVINIPSVSFCFLNRHFKGQLFSIGVLFLSRKKRFARCRLLFTNWVVSQMVSYWSFSTPTQGRITRYFKWYIVQLCREQGVVWGFA